MNFTDSIKNKKFYRFTGPPEHWLTAIKYMTWGLNKSLENRWKEIQTGDIFFIHSTGKGVSMFSNAKSGIIGIGIVGPNFRIKENLLWLKEQKEKENIWPYLIPLSEVYLFSEIPDPETWNNPDLQNQSKTESLIAELLQNSIPLSQIKGFPQMGSFSSVSDKVAEQILFNNRKLYTYGSNIIDNIITAKPTKLEKIERASEALRYSASLAVFSEIKPRIIRKGNSSYFKNNELLSKAEDSHATILQKLLSIFKAHGYETLSNKYIDLFAHNGQKSFLIEVKSTENRNFRSQARKGVIQLFEYDYFEINRYISENNLKFKEKLKLLVPSQKPKDDKYIEFINHLNIGVGLANDSIHPIGVDFGFSKL